MDYVYLIRSIFYYYCHRVIQYDINKIIMIVYSVAPSKDPIAINFNSGLVVLPKTSTDIVSFIILLRLLVTF